MHRTLSLDYAVVLSGEIVLKLDGGREKTIKAGEVVVQRGTKHEWHNRTGEWCRCLVVMVGSEGVRLGDGTVLDETVLGKPPQ
jgi:quercetin dioxygenase-like cupin family protein